MIMNRVMGVVFFLIFSASLYAQSGEIKVIDGKVVEGALFKEKAYMMPRFMDGKVKLTNGEIFEGVLNIHALTQSIRFINDKGDTLGLNDDSIVSTVSAGGYFFIKDKRFYVQMLNTDVIFHWVLRVPLILGLRFWRVHTEAQMMFRQSKKLIVTPLKTSFST
jgi:hypothetical protein